MAAGRPVVVTEGTGMAEMVGEGAFGRVVPSRDAPAIATALLDVLGASAAERQDWGRAARARVLDRYRFDRVAQEQEAAYRQILVRAVAQPA